MSSEWMKVMLEEIARKKRRRSRSARKPWRVPGPGAAPGRPRAARRRMIRQPARDPSQDDTPSTLRPYVTSALIAACCCAFLWQRTLGPEEGRRVVAALGAIPAVLLTDARLPRDLQWIPRYASLFTCMFLHGGWLHLSGNMLYL